MSEHQFNDRVQQRLMNVQRLLIDGQWLEASDGRTEDVYNPSTGEVI